MSIGVFLVDDEPDILCVWRTLIELANDGLYVHGEAGGGPGALSEPDEPDVYVIDYMMPGMGGLELTRQLRERGVQVPIIICTAAAEDDLLERGKAAGATTVIDKASMRFLPAAIRALAA